MDMEIEVLYQNFIKKDPKLLMDYIRNVASGEAVFFPTTLSLVYDRLIGRVFPKEPVSSPKVEKDPWDSLGQDSWGQDYDTKNPFQASSPTSTAAPFFSWTPTVPPSTLTDQKMVKCVRCRKQARLEQLYEGLHCPWCSEDGRNGMGVKGRPYMTCSGCSLLRIMRIGTCQRGSCGATFL